MKVQDHGLPPLSNVAKIKFNVKDSNDNPPVFTQNAFNFVVTENVEANYLVGKVSAEDKDSGANAKITYQFKSASRAFTIDGPTGMIFNF